MHVLGVPWLQLPGQQNILLQTSFTDSEYSVRVTDLSNIWGEDLKRQQIKQRAEDLDCPIDADANLEDLLKRLQDALTVDSGAISILLKRSKDRLQLSSTEHIGCATIEWDFHLELLPYSAVASGLTLSLFSMMSYYQRSVKDLLEVIREKDAVIRQMNDFCTNANLTFRPSRRPRAFKPFEDGQWLRKCRSKAQEQALGSQDVLEELSHVGREAEFRKDWRAVLENVPQWELEFLPDTTERTPTPLTSSVARQKTGLAGTSISRARSPPVMGREDTTSQAAEFATPQTSRIKQKNMM